MKMTKTATAKQSKGYLFYKAGIICSSLCGFLPLGYILSLVVSTGGIWELPLLKTATLAVMSAFSLFLGVEITSRYNMQQTKDKTSLAAIRAEQIKALEKELAETKKKLEASSKKEDSIGFDE